MMPSEDRCDPDETEDTGTHQADNHGKSGIPDAAKHTGHDVHDAAEEIGDDDDL